MFKKMFANVLPVCVGPAYQFNKKQNASGRLCATQAAMGSFNA